MTINNIQTIEPTTIDAKDPMLAMIDRVCTDPSFDIDKMQKLIDMRNQEVDRQAKVQFNTAFASMQNKLPRVVATHKNTQTKSNYTKLEDINFVISPVLKEFGFGTLFKVLSQDETGVKIQATLTHNQGHNESTELFMPYDDKGIAGTRNKTLIHATGSTITYAKRYAICMLLNISTGDDNDGQKQEATITQEQFETLTSLLEESKIDKIKFTAEYLKIDNLSQLNSSLFNKVKGVLNQRIEENKKSVS